MEFGPGGGGPAQGARGPSSEGVAQENVLQHITADLGGQLAALRAQRETRSGNRDPYVVQRAAL
eukprot:8775679-Lingulodinium_polyedra.AAC.1